MGLFNKIIEKLNPAQPEIYMDQGETQSATISPLSVYKAFTEIEVVNRGVSLIVDSAAEFDFDVKEKVYGLGINPYSMGGSDKKKLHNLLNFKPNPYQNIDSFRRNCYTDFILDGNIFIYYDGSGLYHLPASNVKIIADKKTFVKGYEYNDTKFSYDEIAHVKDNSANSIYRGDSRLLPALKSATLLYSMGSYQQNYFDNNAIPGLVLKTKNTLSRKVKDRILQEWMRDYNPKRGGKRPAILDGDFDIESLGHTDFRELDFKDSSELQETKILKALGVPPLLLDSGNNANITPNIKMFYVNTVLPIVDHLAKAMEFYFGFDLQPVKENVLALQPELKEEAQYYSTFVNTGIMTINEAREKLRLEKSKEKHADELRIPANIAGSAVDPSQGGKPKQPPKDEKEPSK